MTDARSAILDRLKAQSNNRIAAINTEISNQESDFYDAGFREISQSNKLERFVKNAQAANASVTMIDKRECLAEDVEDYLFQQKLPCGIQLSDISLTQLFRESNIQLHYGECTFDHRVSLIRTYAGIAETGTLVSLSSQNLSTGSLFLTEHCIAVLESTHIVDGLEDIWQLLNHDGNSLPRTVNCITGPSRTGDIEQSIEIGAHGPCYLHIIIIGNNDDINEPTPSC